MSPTRNCMSCGASSIEPLEPRTLLAVAGTLDPSFSGDGKATFTIDLNVAFALEFVATDVAVQADGKTVVAGISRRVDQQGQWDFAAVRFNLDGSRDQTFGSPLSPGPGIVFAHPGKTGARDIANAVAIQGDGKIVVAGESDVDTFGNDTRQFAVVRFNPDGSHDNSFSGNGVRNIEMGLYADAHDVAIQADGKIVLVGSADPGNNDSDDLSDYAMVRLHPNGDLDSTFNSDGKKKIFIGGDDRARAVAIDSAGNYVLVGSSSTGNLETLSAIRVKREGPLDTSFDGDGRLLVPITGHTRVQAEDLLLQADNKIIVVGRTTAIGDDQMIMLRLNFDGTLDTTFGTNGTGVVETPNMDAATSIIRSADGGLIVGGEIAGNFGLAGYDANGVIKTGFGTTGSGLVFTSFGNINGGVRGLAKGPGRRFVAAGGAPGATARYLDTGANVVHATPLFDSQAAEANRDPASFFVFREERLPFTTRVFFSIGGTANRPGFFNVAPDYSVSPMSTSPFVGGTYVDIPPNQTFTVVTLTPVDDTLVESTETAVFNILPSSTYEIGTPSSATLTISSNDIRFFVPIGTSTVTPSAAALPTNGKMTYDVEWTHPGVWRDLDTIEFRIVDDRDVAAGGVLAWVKWDQTTDALSLYDPRTGQFTGSGQPGSNRKLKAGDAELYLRDSAVVGSGPTGQSVKLTLALKLNPTKARGSPLPLNYRVEVFASDDAGDKQGFDQVGTLTVPGKHGSFAAAWPSALAQPDWRLGLHARPAEALFASDPL